MENTTQVENDETTLLQNTETQSLTAPQPEPQAAEMVDFHLTPPVLANLETIVMWTKILVGCLVLIILAELLFGFSAAYKISRYVQPITAANVLLFSRSFLSIVANGVLIYFGLKFVRNMNQALKFNNNQALETAFGHQNQYLKWVFINMLATAIYTVFNGMI